MAATTTDSNSKIRLLGSVAQRVIDPANPQSLSASSFHSALHAAVLEIDFSEANYLIYLPDGAFIRSIVVAPTISFSTATTMNVGSTDGGNDLLASIDLTTQSISVLSSPLLAGAILRFAVQNIRPMYFTISGSPAQGHAFVLIEYFNTK